MSSAAAAKWKPKKRSFNESFLSTLLSPPNIVCSGTNNVYDGNVANMSTYELKSTLQKLKDIRSSKADDTDDDESIIYQPSRKRAKQTINHNNSILKFVDRVVHQRYTNNNNRSNCPHFTFLQNELRSQFGTKDIVFQAEEDIINLVFEIVISCIKQRAEDIKSNDTMNSLGYSSDILCDYIVKTGLQIVDIIVQYDRHERTIRTRLYQSRNNKEDHPSSVLAGSTDEGRRSRRSKYEHLLEPKKKKKKCKEKTHNTSAADNVKTCMEEALPEQWNWLCQFRTESKIQSTEEVTEELQQLHYSEKKNNTDASPLAAQHGKEVPGDNNFVIIKRRIETLDDISISSTESDDEELDVEMEVPDTRTQEQKDISVSTSIQKEETNQDTATSNTLTAPPANPPSPFEKLHKETNNLRLTLVDMPTSESSSAEVIRHTVDEIKRLLCDYGEVDGASGITRCGEIFAGQHVIDTSKDQASKSTQTFPINDAMVASLVKTFLTDAMGALRAKAFLRAFVLPLMLEMNPNAKASSEYQTTKSSKDKPASRVLTSLLTSLARDRSMECVVSVLVPTLVLKKYLPSSTAAHESLFEPTRFQCELISRILKGRDGLSAAAITLFVEELLPTTEEIKSSLNDTPQVRGGMKWTDNTMPLLSACLNRQPDLPDNVVSRLADEISYQLSSKATPSMVKSMKLSTLFHTFVTKYGAQVKSTGKVESLKDSCKLLKTFMSKTISMALKKIS